MGEGWPGLRAEFHVTNKQPLLFERVEIEINKMFQIRLRPNILNSSN